MDFTLYHGDCLHIMAGMDANSVDAIVTDPPYGLGFMGKHWDYGVPGVDFWREALRVLKPGGHLLAFGGTRTYHRLAVAIEDAGFEIRDQVQWIYGSGFPKSLDVSKAIDAMHGAEREVTGNTKYAGFGRHGRTDLEVFLGNAGESNKRIPITAPATPDAMTWQGWGTALKPANEPICMARKPLAEGTVAANVLAWGTGAINVDGCRVGTESTPRKDPRNGNLTNAHLEMRPWMKRRIENGEPLKGDFDGSLGRWPANVIHDGSDEVTGLFPVTGPSSDKPRHNGEFKSVAKGRELTHTTYGHDDAGGSAARFFYCAKASKAERDAGLEGEFSLFRQVDGVEVKELKGFNASPLENHGEIRNTNLYANHHPTVKPITLMRYLCRLITPPGGTVLDPFMGSGSTGAAALLEGFAFVGIEMEQEYIDIAQRRIGWAQRQMLHNAKPLPLWAGEVGDFAMAAD